MSRNLRLGSFLAAAVALVAGSASAAVTNVNLAGFNAFDGGFPGSLNSQQLINIAPNVGVTAVSFTNLQIQLSNGSFASEFTISTNDSANSGAAGTFWDYRPFSSTDTPNPAGPISGSFTAPSNQFSSGPFNLLADGNLLLYVYDTFNDAGAAVDATVISGTLSITTGVIAPPTPPASTAVVTGGSISGNLAAAQVNWYSFTLAAPQAVSFDTEGTLLSATNDTELFLYNSAGALLGTDDDDGTGNLSILNSGDELPALLPAGTYYLGLGAFNTVGGPGFGLTSTSVQTGPFVLNGVSVVPEPTTLAALAMGGLLTRRRRA